MTRVTIYKLAQGRGRDVAHEMGGSEKAFLRKHLSRELSEEGLSWRGVPPGADSTCRGVGVQGGGCMRRGEVAGGLGFRGPLL